MAVRHITDRITNSLTSSLFASHQLTIKHLVIFEMKSLIGRTVCNKKPPICKTGVNLLNLGCAVTTFSGWVNADFFPSLISLCTRKNVPDWMLDLRYSFNCSSDIWDGVFCEHTIEHLYPIEVFNLLCELHRTMKTGAWLRLSVPDLGKYVSFYSGQLHDKEFSQWSSGCEAICNLTQNYQHKSVWDAVMLGEYLEKAGFTHISKKEFREGTDTRLLKDREERKWETLYMEAKKY